MLRGFALSSDLVGKSWSFFKRLFGLALLVALIWKSEPKKIGEALGQLPIKIIFLCIIVEVTALVLDAYKQYLWLRRSGYALKFLEIVQIRFLGSFGNNFLPSSLASDVIRATALKSKSSGQDAWASTLMCRFQGLVALFPLILFGLNSDLFSKIQVSKSFIFYFMVLFLVIYSTLISKGTLTFFEKRSVSFLKKAKLEGLLGFFRVLVDYKKHWDLMFFGFLLSLLYHFATITTTWLIFGFTIPELSFLHLLLVIPLTSLITMIPVSFNGIGVQEVSLLWLVQQYASHETIIASSIVWHFVRISATLPGAAYFFKRA